MLLTFDDMRFLSETTEPAEKGMLKARKILSKEDKERLLAIDERNVMCYEEHLIANYKDL